MSSFNVTSSLCLLVESLLDNQDILLSTDEYQILKKTGILTKHLSLESFGNDILQVAINIYYPEEDSTEFDQDTNGLYIVPKDSLGSPFLEVSEDEDDEEIWE